LNSAVPLQKGAALTHMGTHVKKEGKCAHCSPTMLKNAERQRNSNIKLWD